MAIKAIINNTEKEIEQIKNSDEQDIDYVYSRIGDTEVEGTPPISIKSIGGNLADYRIYGQTVGGESVGDRTGNLFDKSGSQYGNNLHWVPNFSLVYSDTYYGSPIMDVTGLNTITRSYTGTGANYFSTSDLSQFVNVSNIGTVDAGVTVNVPDGYTKYVFNIPNTIRPDSIMVNSGSTALPYEPYGYKVPVTVSNGTDTLTIPIYLPEQIKKVGDEAEYISYSDQKMHRIGADDIDVTLPALPTLPGTNTFSVNTSIQPSNMYIKDNFDYKKVFTATRAIEGELPLSYRSIEDSDSTLKNYRIYGTTVNGESVGDKTANLIQGSIKNANIGSNGKINTSNEFNLVYAPVVTGESYTISNNDGTNVYAFYNAVPSAETATSYDSSRQVFSTSTITFVSPTTGYIAVRLANTAQDIMINPGSTALPYEPYGYKVPVTVEGKNLFSSRIEQGSFDGITGVPNNSSTRVRSHEDDYIFLTPGVYKISAMGVEHLVVYAYDLPNVNAFNHNLSRTNWAPLSSTITINTSAYYKFGFCKTNNPIITPSDVSNIMLNTGSTALPYEPYHAPVTTPIYLPEPIKMVGDEAEYVDYKEQKWHRVRKNLAKNNHSSSSSLFTVEEVDNYIHVSGTNSSDREQAYLISGQNMLSVGTYDLVNNSEVSIKYDYINSNNVLIGALVNAGSIQTIIISNPIIRGLNIYKSVPVNVSIDDYFQVMLVKHGENTSNYEPYIENTDLDVTLPALPTIKGTNTLTVGTEVQPSGVEIKGHIK